MSMKKPRSWGAALVAACGLTLNLAQAQPDTGVELLASVEVQDSDYVDITQMDCNIGGITECFYVAKAGALQGKIHCPHNWHGGFTTMSNVHLTAAIPNRHYCELNQTFNPLKEGVFKEPFTVKDGWMELPEKPGYGVEIIDDLEKKFPYVEGDYHRHNRHLPG